MRCQWPATVLPLLAVAVAFTAPPAAHGGAPASVAVAALNAQRERNGFPAELTEQPLYDQGCTFHNHYQHLNNELTHDEVLGSPDGRSSARAATDTSAKCWLRPRPTGASG